jgi:hypothetical protein
MDRPSVAPVSLASFEVTRLAQSSAKGTSDLEPQRRSHSSKGIPAHECLHDRRGNARSVDASPSEWRLFSLAATDREGFDGRSEHLGRHLGCGLKHQNTQHPAPTNGALTAQLSGHAQHLPARPKVGRDYEAKGRRIRVVERRRLLEDCAGASPLGASGTAKE